MIYISIFPQKNSQPLRHFFVSSFFQSAIESFFKICASSNTQAICTPHPSNNSFISENVVPVVSLRRTSSPWSRRMACTAACSRACWRSLVSTAWPDSKAHWAAKSFGQQLATWKTKWSKADGNCNGWRHHFEARCKNWFPVRMGKKEVRLSPQPTATNRGGSAKDIKSWSTCFRFLSQVSVAENKTHIPTPTRIITSLRSLWDQRPFTIKLTLHLLKLLLRQGCGAPRQQRPQLPYATSNHSQVWQQQRRIGTGPGSGRGRVVCYKTRSNH